MDNNTENAIINSIGELGVKLDESNKALIEAMREDAHETHRLLKKLIKSVEANEERFSAIEMRLQQLEGAA